MEYGMLLILLGPINLIFILSHLIFIQGRGSNVGDFMKKMNIGMHLDIY